MSNPGIHASRPPSHSAHLAPSAQAERLAVRVDRAYISLLTCSRHLLLLLTRQWLMTERHLTQY